MIIFCRHCGMKNEGDYKEITKAICSKCNSKAMISNNKIIIECGNCGLAQHKDIWNFESRCISCNHEMENPLHSKCWGRTVNKGHSFVKFSLNLKKEELSWLKNKSKNEGVQVGQILRLLVRKEGGLICTAKKKDVENAE